MTNYRIAINYGYADKRLALNKSAVWLRVVACFFKQIICTSQEGEKRFFLACFFGMEKRRCAMPLSPITTSSIHAKRIVMLNVFNAIASPTPGYGIPNIPDVRSATDLSRFGDSLEDDKTVTLSVQGVWQKLDKVACYARAVELNERHPSGFFKLGKALHPGCKVVVQLNGRMHALDQKACYAKAVECNPRDGNAFHFLGYTLKPGEHIAVALNGRTELLDKKTCYVRAAELQPTNGVVIGMVGRLLNPNEHVDMMFNGRLESLDSRGCFIKSLALPQGVEDTASTFLNLGITLNPDEQVDIEFKKELETHDRKTCFMKALKLKPDFGYAFFHLGKTLLEGEHIQLNADHIDKRQCYCKALQHGDLPEFVSEEVCQYLDTVNEGVDAAAVFEPASRTDSFASGSDTRLIEFDESEASGSRRRLPDAPAAREMSRSQQLRERLLQLSQNR